MTTHPTPTIPKGWPLSNKGRLALLHLIGCGQALSNIAFNLAQQDAAKEWHPTLNRWRKEWDAAQVNVGPYIRRIRKKAGK
jgi:hypothetical protein